MDVTKTDRSRTHGRAFAVALAALLLSAGLATTPNAAEAESGAAEPSPAAEAAAAKPAAKGATAKAVFAGGCFWCMEPPYDGLDGVLSTISGYTGGSVENPTYDQVSDGSTGHVEAVEIEYDPARVSYEKLLEVFWRNVDPTDDGGQFCDRGPQYLSAVFVQDEAQRRLAEQSREAAAKKKKVAQPITTQIRPVAPFYPAEDEHQDYYEKNPISYRYYRYSCGRDQRLTEVWGEDAASH